jgi:hypothetical protein
MALLDKTTLQKSAGLLNATAPEDHFLAYITEGERDMLVRAGGKETSTVSGIKAYPPPGEKGGGGYMGSSGDKTTSSTGDYGFSGGQETNRERAIRAAATTGSSYTGGVDDPDPPHEYIGGEKVYIGDVEGKRIAQEKADVKPEETNWFDGVKDYILSGGIVGKTIELTGDVLSKLGEFSSELQKKAMTMSLNSRVKSKMKDLDLNNPNSMNNPEIADLHKDLAGIEAGTFTQNDFTEKYGSGDLSTEGGGDREIMNVATPYASYAVANQEPIESQAAQWYANLGGSSGGFNLTTAYAAAKSKVAQTLGSPSAVGQLAVNQSPFYNWLKENSLNKGIL